MGEEKHNLWEMIDKYIPEKQKKFLFQTIIILTIILLTTLVFGIGKLVFVGGQANLFGKEFGFEYKERSEEENAINITQGVTDIGNTRIQWGTFETGQDWERIEFLEPFKDENISISVSTTDSPIHYYSFYTRSITRYGFETAFKAEEADPIFTKYLETELGKTLTKEDMKKYGAANFNADFNQIWWLFNISALKGNYIAIGLKP